MLSEISNWSDLRVFLVVYREGSTLAAAKGLGVAQPTVARRIEALEHALKLTLFERDTRGFHPTDAAKALLPGAEAMEAAAAGLTGIAQGLHAPQVIRITAFQRNFNDAFTDIIAGFHADYPDVEFEFLPGTRKYDLMAGEADIALRLTFGGDPPDLISRRVGKARFTLYGAPAYAKRHGLPATPEDMAGHTLFSVVRKGMAPVLHTWLQHYVSEAEISRTYTEIGMLDAAVRAGQGLAINNLGMAEKDEAEGRLIRCFDPPEAWAADHLMLISPEAWRRPEVKAFARFFAPRYARLFSHLR
ncbi:LysR family transcriptional regulator [Gymnodinialimonas ulvae]|uniref:LysR family transcriptional regulator n=1 Tax=Gymnodinialimonas ulvae TaxID=3126504 RepID=UPI0030EE8C19